MQPPHIDVIDLTLIHSGQLSFQLVFIWSINRLLYPEC